MDVVRLGKSGLKVSRICLGTMTFGREADEATSFAIMDRYLEVGGIFLDTADGYSKGITEFICYQPCYNAVNRAIETEMLPLCHEEGLGVISYNPLASGMLTGKYRRGEALPASTRLTEYQRYHDRYVTDEAMDVAERFILAARERGFTPAQLALAWVLGEPRVTCPILGARTIEQFNDSIGGLEISLTPAEREAIPSIGHGRWVGDEQLHGRQD